MGFFNSLVLRNMSPYVFSYCVAGTVRQSVSFVKMNSRDKQMVQGSDKRENSSTQLRNDVNERLHDNI